MRANKILKAKKNIVALNRRRKYSKKLIKLKIKASSLQWFFLNCAELERKKEQELESMGLR